MIATPTRHKFTVDRLALIEQSGAFPAEQHIELINGEIIDMSPINPSHASCVTKLNRFFTLNLPVDKYIVSVQNPARLSEYSLPQPDVVIAHYREELLETMHMQAQDITVLIEVADTSYQYDRHTKYPLYASAGIPVYWIVNLHQKQVEIYTHPKGEEYTQQKICKSQFEALGLSITLKNIFPNDPV